MISLPDAAVLRSGRPATQELITEDPRFHRGDQIHAIEVKTARATSPHLARLLRAALADIGALGVCVIDQGAGADPLAPAIDRRGFEMASSWLPG